MFRRPAPALVLISALLFVASCASLGLEPAESFEDRVGYALGTHTAVLQATTRALNLGEISSAEAEDVASLADRSRALIDTARRVHAAGDTDQASRTLAMAITVLNELQAYLRRGGSP